MNTNLRIETKKFATIRDLRGISARTMEGHHENYRSYVAKTNEILDRLAKADRTAAHPVYSEFRALKVELPAALAAAKSYEIFFSQLGGKDGKPQGTLAEMLTRDFGSYQGFLDEFTATAFASRGWAALVYDLDLKKFVCMLGDTPEKLTVWNVTPVIVMEVSEHSSSSEFGNDRIMYIHALLENLDWSVVQRNLENALGLQPVGRPH